MDQVPSLHPVRVLIVHTFHGIYFFEAERLISVAGTRAVPFRDDVLCYFFASNRNNCKSAVRKQAIPI